MKNITIPLDEETIVSLRVGDLVSLNGIMYTARDQAHLRLKKLIEDGKDLPIELEGQLIYYCGPTPKKDEMVIGSCGPTTSSRMDSMTPILLRRGLKGLLGKGARSEEVIAAIKKNKAVYLIAPAGAGAYLSQKVLNSEVVAFEDLGPEAIFRLEVKDFPAIVCIDSTGNILFK